MKAIDDVKILQKEIPAAQGKQTLRSFLLNQLGSSNGSFQKIIHQFCDSYESARHDPSEFGDQEYQKYHHLLLKLIES
jgi:NICE-3 protein